MLGERKAWDLDISQRGTCLLEGDYPLTMLTMTQDRPRANGSSQHWVSEGQDHFMARDAQLSIPLARYLSLMSVFGRWTWGYRWPSLLVLPIWTHRINLSVCHCHLPVEDENLALLVRAAKAWTLTLATPVAISRWFRGEKSSFLKKSVPKHVDSYLQKKLELGFCLTVCKTQPKWAKNVNLRAKDTNFYEKKSIDVHL